MSVEAPRGLTHAERLHAPEAWARRLSTSWDEEAVSALLAERGVGCCVMSGAHLPCVLRVTAPFAGRSW